MEEIELKDYGWNVPRGLILFELICHHGQTTQKELGRILRLPRYSVSRNIDFLESRGWILRIEDPDEARRVMISLTETGQVLSPKLTSLIRSTYNDPFSVLDKKEQVDLFKMLG